MSVAKAYARALYQNAHESGASAEQLDRIQAELNEFVGMLDRSRDAEVALLAPVASSKEKASIIEQIAQKTGMSEPVSRFLVLLAQKGRLPLIREIRGAYTSARLEAEGGVEGHLVTADPLDKADVDSLAKAFSKKIGKPVTFQVATDPALLAGMKVTVNGVTYDGTLRSQLQQLRDQIINVSI